MTEQTEPEREEEIAEHESTTDDGGDVAETPEGDEHGREADPMTRPAGPAPDGRTTGEAPST
jgi:hypothetical protein